MVSMTKTRFLAKENLHGVFDSSSNKGSILIYLFVIKTFFCSSPFPQGSCTKATLESITWNHNSITCSVKVYFVKLQNQRSQTQKPFTLNQAPKTHFFLAFSTVKSLSRANPFLLPYSSNSLCIHATHKLAKVM